MDTRVLCPFSASTFLWAPELRSFSVTVVVKATFSLVHGAEAALAAKQDSVHDDIPWDASPRGSLYAPSDFVPFKRRADVLLAGHAYAPGGAPVESLTAEIRVGSLTKSLRLTGDRVWIESHGGLAPGPARPFVEMPIRYERAPRHPDNPVGVAVAPDAIAAGLPLPNIEPAPDHAGATPGFGALHPRWRAERDRLSDDAIVWAHRLRGSLEPAPAGFDFGFFNSAPRDQQVDRIDPGVSITLTHLHPWIERFETRLPAVWPKVFRVSAATGEPAEVPMRCDTLWIDAYRSIAVVSFRGAMAVSGPEDRASSRLVIAAESPGKPAHYDDIAHRQAERVGDRAKSTPPSPPAAERSGALDARLASPPLDRTMVLDSEDLAAAEAPARADLTLDLCAAIAAELDLRGVPAKEVLGPLGRTEVEYELAASRWAGAIAHELDRGVTEMQEQYDAAYVRRIERDRGPLGPDDHARLLLGAEPPAPLGLALPPAGLRRVLRAGLRRLASDAGFADRLLRAAAAAR
ncbi:MAG: DUF2169 domain-containing protein [Polyangiaceae bacterium]|nr:DUF2169 domain-containing protein [Polyangiaceae bacterium]